MSQTNPYIAKDGNTHQFLPSVKPKQPRFHYCAAGCGFILYEGRQAIWETTTMSEMISYMKANGIKDVEYRRPSLLVITPSNPAP